MRVESVEDRFGEDDVLVLSFDESLPGEVRPSVPCTLTGLYSWRRLATMTDSSSNVSSGPTSHAGLSAAGFRNPVEPGGDAGRSVRAAGPR